MINLENEKYLLKKSLPIIMKKGKGVYLYDSEGHRYLDMTATAWTMNLGYGNQKVINATIKQLRDLSHVRTHFYTDVKLALAKTIIDLCPIKDGRVDFCLHGSAANEGAMKIALNKHPGRETIMYLENGFHGRTCATMSVSWKHANKKLQAFYGPNIEAKKDLSDIEEKMIAYKPAAFILELIQGNGGQDILDVALVQGIRELCSKYDVTMIVDEIQTAFGRCGIMFVSDYFEIVPDIITFGKAVSNGIPLFGLIASSGYDYEADDHSFTYAHCPLGMASALATIEQITPELLQECIEKGEYIEKKVSELQKQFPVFGKIKRMGLMIGVDIVDKEGNPSVEIAEYIMDEMLKQYVIMNLSKCRGEGFTLKFKPALTITYSQLDKVFVALKKVVRVFKI
jgi:4-aminobutyrate aminotransferase-like enzyme